MEIKGYDSMIKGADSYYNSARKAFYKDSKFNTELIFNILTMSIEKYLVGLLMSKGIMPLNHVIKHLLKETEEHFKLDVIIQKHLAKVDDYLYICSLDDFTKKIPSKEEMENIMVAVEQLKVFTHAHTLLESA
ncbi:MAG: HEPN domain-containing protein [Bacteroidales bacterium]|nr:HEPN domain-containing protein [Bacteroidales bacterium]